MTASPSDTLRDATRLLRDGEPVEAVRLLRWTADELPVQDVARVIGEAARALGQRYLADLAHAVTRRPGSAKALYRFGYQCVEDGGLAFAAVPALTEALRLRPRDTETLIELAVALERVDRNAEAVEVLEQHGADPRRWPMGFLLSSNALLAGDTDRAIRYRHLLPMPPDRVWAGTDRWLTAAIDRLDRVRPGPDDLRGWHYVINGGVLASMSPSVQEGMNGRYAWLQASTESVRHGLHRVRVALEAAGHRPSSVGLLPDRSSTILGLAAAQVLDLPARPYVPRTPGCLVVAFDLAYVVEPALEALGDRAPGEVLVEYASCWTYPPVVSADLTGLLVQSIRAPWDERMVFAQDGRQELPADDRDVEAIAADLAVAEHTADGDEDGDEVLAGFVAGLGREWPSNGSARFTPRSPGPVRSSSFQ
jgi:hypothetical protein